MLGIRFVIRLKIMNCLKTLQSSRVVFATIFILLILTVTAIPVHADCRGCCSRHGGVECVDGITKCRDESPLSSKCKSKGCDKCGSVSSPPTIVPNTQEAALLPVPDKPKEPITVSPGSFRCNGHVAFGIPGPDDQLLCREGYAVGYDYDKKIPAWVAYRLTPDSVNKKFKRSNKFKEDTEIPTQYRSTLSDYKGSGYDRGHMAASATVDSSYNAMMESFLLSNMTPCYVSI